MTCFNIKVQIRISETMRNNDFGNTLGVYSPKDGIIVKRSKLNSKKSFLGMLIHEFTHHISGANDHTREFENQLTEFLGILLANQAEPNSKNSTIDLTENDYIQSPPIEQK